MASNHQPPEGFATDDFFEQILAIPSSYSGLPLNDVGSSSDAPPSMTSAAISGLHHHHHHHHQQSQLFPLGLSLDNNGRDDTGDTVSAFELKPDGESMNMGHMYPMFEHLQPPPPPMRHVVPQVFQGQPNSGSAVSAPQPPTIRPRVRARRGQATDPHSIAERLRRERISEKIKALQELVPSCNKTDRAAMLDEILDYVKFLRLQVKVLSMSRLGGAGAVAQLVADIQPQCVEGESVETGPNPHVWEKWSNEETEEEVAKLMEEDVGAAMQFLQSKSLCIMPISLAALIYPTSTTPHQPDDPSFIKPEHPASS